MTAAYRAPLGTLLVFLALTPLQAATGPPPVRGDHLIAPTALDSPPPGRTPGVAGSGASIHGRLFGQASQPEHTVDEDDGVEPLEFGAEVELVLEAIGNLTLGEESRDDLRTMEQELLLELAYNPGGIFSAFAAASLIAELEDSAGSGTQSETGLERGEMWIQFQRPFEDGLFVRIGRQSFEEPRRWWWDEDLDAVRVGYASRSWELSVAAAQAVAPESTVDDFVDPENERVLRLLGHLQWRISESVSLAAFYLHQRDESDTPPIGGTVPPEREDSSDADLDWVGLRALGGWEPPGSGSLSYWADAALVVGEETLFEFGHESGRNHLESRRRRRVRGWAIDLGVTWVVPVTLSPALTVRHARTSADDDPDDDVDRTFRQTGLQDPDQETRLYGELLQPELSNLAITTVAIALPLLEDSTVTLGYHRFRQIRAAPFLRDSRLEAEPNGESRDVGSEVSVVLRLREWDDLAIDVAGASFRAGSAFGDSAGDRATSVFLQITYEF